MSKGRFVPPSVYMGFRLFVLEKRCPGQWSLSLRTNLALNVGAVVDLVAAVAERESSLFAEEELEEVGRVEVRRDRVGLVGRIVSEAGFAFGFLGGELELELVVDLVDRAQVRQIGAR